MKNYEDLSRIKVQEAIQQGLVAQRLQRELHQGEIKVGQDWTMSVKPKRSGLSLIHLFRQLLSPGNIRTEW